MRMEVDPKAGGPELLEVWDLWQRIGLPVERIAVIFRPLSNYHNLPISESISWSSGMTRSYGLPQSRLQVCLGLASVKTIYLWWVRFYILHQGSWIRLVEIPWTRGLSPSRSNSDFLFLSCNRNSVIWQKLAYFTVYSHAFKTITRWTGMSCVRRRSSR